MSATTKSVRVANVKVGTRHRVDLGDIDALARSLAELGLLHPIGLTPKSELVFGQRRLEAAKKLGWKTIDAREVDVDALIAERDENLVRKDFTPSERVSIAEAVRARIGPRQGQRTDRLVQEVAEVQPGVKTRDHAASIAGFGNHETYRQAKTVIERGAPVLREAMDSGAVSISAAAALTDRPLAEQIEVVQRVVSGEAKTVSDALRDVRRRAVRTRLEDVAVREAKAASGIYDVLVVDPPWPMQKIERDVRPNQVDFDYPTMSEDELRALTLPCADDCHVWLWTTQKFLPMALRLLEAWRLSYVCTFVWHKPGGFQPIGLPQYNCEFALYARRGSPAFLDTKAFSTCFNAPRGAHSEKPEEFYDVLRRVTGGRRLDMFNRRAIDGFDGWGKEAAE